MDSTPPQLPKKRAYVTPQVRQVQRRVDGDNLAAGCKINVEGGSGIMINACTLQSCKLTGS
ncbi:hypothetical protein OAX78_00875 [Planctomycetota bacterium]|nr:hypothetical protein [Planctomycetota bacterium]